MSPRLYRGLTPPILLLLAWQGASSAAWLDPQLVPPPAEVLHTAWRLFADPSIYVALGASLGRCLAGFVVGGGLGLAFGLLCGLSHGAGRLIGPSFHALKNVAIFAWIPLIGRWFGFGEQARIAFVAIATFTPVVLNTWEGVAGTAPKLLEVGAALRFTWPQRPVRIRLPGALPSLLTGARLGAMQPGSRRSAPSTSSPRVLALAACCWKDATPSTWRSFCSASCCWAWSASC